MELHAIVARLEEKVRERTEALLGGLIAALDYRDADVGVADRARTRSDAHAAVT